MATSHVLPLLYHHEHEQQDQDQRRTRGSSSSSSSGGSGSLKGMQQASCTSSAPRTCYTASPVVHACNMTGLSPGTLYYYRFGDAAVGFTKTYKFTTLQTPGKTTSGDAVVTAVVYGDMGLDYSENTRAMLAKMASASDIDDPYPLRFSLTQGP